MSTRILRLLPSLPSAVRVAGLLALAALSGSLRAAPAEAPRQGAALLATDILGVFAHPDDETGMAATLARYARAEGRTIAHAYVTRGEGGGNMVGTQAGPALGILREAELRDCLRLLGVRFCYFLDQEDFFYTESHAATLRKWNREEALRKLVRLVRALRPQVIVTLNPAPVPGQHGHHQAAGVLATEAFRAAADPGRFPEQLTEEGLSLWQPRKLYYGGASGPNVTTITTTEPLIDGRSPADIAGEALSQHRSQAFGGFVNSPWLRRPQGFTQVFNLVGSAPTSSDFFDGLPCPDPVWAILGAQTPAREPIAFRPRPAIRNFLAWADRMGIRHVTSGLAADVPVVAGETAEVLLEAEPAVAGELAPSLRFATDAGWSVLPSGKGVRDAASSTARFVARVAVPPDALTDTQIHATARLREADVHASARLHPVPFARLPRLRGTPALDGSTNGWERAGLLEIGTNRVWQGRVDSPADCSATVRVGHDGRALLVAVDVTDDVVVSNIEPNDIKGHWRSDSVEICLDPAAGAEDTTGCFKIGIFPFDTTGKVRAARDADAHQGPVEVTAPGLVLASRRLPDGYRVEARIPWELVTGKRRTPGRLGFNVLVYDGDKAHAAPGENINECRLAWAPRSGVQGRPEDWGRIELE